MMFSQHERVRDGLIVTDIIIFELVFFRNETFLWSILTDLSPFLFRTLGKAIPKVKLARLWNINAAKKILPVRDSQFSIIWMWKEGGTFTQSVKIFNMCSHPCLLKIVHSKGLEAFYSRELQDVIHCHKKLGAHTVIHTRGGGFTLRRGVCNSHFLDVHTRDRWL